MKKFLAVAITIVAALFTTETMAQSTPVRKDLMNAIISQKVAVADVQEITMLPGQAAPKHLHPCPVVGYIVSGTVLFQLEGGEPRVLKEGEPFFEPKNKTVLHFDNASKDKPLKFLAIYLREGNEAHVKLLNE